MAPPKLTDYGELFMPSEALEPILARPVAAALTEWLTEIWAEAALAEVGIPPRKRAIFDGPPGVGKTTLAHHLAARLGLPMLAVRPDRLGGQHIHESGINIGGLFDAARRGMPDAHAPDGSVPVMLFLDEFDAIAHERRRADHSAGDDRNEAVNVLLQRLEQHDGFVIAATNHGKAIDPAIWRRFDMHITLELPGPVERRHILKRYLHPFALPPGPLAAMAEALELASPALMRALCENIKRQIVIGPLLGSDMSRGAVIDRVLASVHPHPDVGKPRLWSHGSMDKAVQSMPWPLPRAGDAAAEPEPPQEATVVAFRGRP